MTLAEYTIITYATMDTERDVFYGYEIVVYGLLLICGVSSCWEIAREGPVEGVSCGSRELLQWTVKTVVGASKWHFSDGLYTEVLFWHASGPIAQRWIVLRCLESC
jgi:hypothetical protein